MVDPITKLRMNFRGGLMKRQILATVMLAMFILAVPNVINAISQAGVLSLSIEPGARANGMGRAYSAIADDAYAAWWNPGALAFNRKTQFAGSHTPWLQGIGSGADDMYYEFFAWNQYFSEIGNLGMNIVWMDMGTQMQMSEDAQELGEFHSYDLAAAVSYAYEAVPEKIGIGGNFKVIYSYLGPGTGETEKEGSGFSWAFDLGLKMKDIFNLSTQIPNMGIPGFQPSIDAALVIQNIGPNITYVNEEQSDPLPQTVRAGLGVNLFNSPYSKVKLSAEASRIIANEDNMFARFATGWSPIEETIYAAGAEYTYFDLLSLRAGWFHDKVGKIVGPSYGAGVQYGITEAIKLGADVAMIVAGDLTDYNMYYSLSFEF